MLDLAKFERPTELGHVLTPGLPILPHGVERHLVPGGGSRGIEIREGDQITVVNDIIDNMGDMISQSVGARISVNISQEADLWPTQIDVGDFEDSIINLCINARDAMPDGGAIMIKTENKSVDEAAQRIHPSLTQGDYVLVSVSDSGIGIATSAKVTRPTSASSPRRFGCNTHI